MVVTTYIFSITELTNFYTIPLILNHALNIVHKFNRNEYFLYVVPTDNYIKEIYCWFVIIMRVLNVLTIKEINSTFL